ncbi:MAG: methyltransferase domain-containing protein [Terracidiphilus sp.]
MSTKTIYEDGSYLSSNPTWHAEDSPWKAEQISKILIKNKIDPSTVCEIGCGAGEILNCLADFAAFTAFFTGYEISPQAFDICSMKQRQNLYFQLGDLLDEKDAWFDVVMAIDVFEHVELH